MRQQADWQLADGPERRAAAHRAPGGPVPEEDVQKVQPEAHVSPDAAGERVGGAGVSGQGEHQAGVHRLKSHRRWEPEADPGFDLDFDSALLHLHAHVGRGGGGGGRWQAKDP